MAAAGAPPPPQLALGLEQWVALQEELIAAERDEELRQAYGTLTKSTPAELEAAGIALLRLTVLEVSTGLFGRTLLTVGDAFGRPLPGHRFTSGDIVGIRVPGSAKSGPGAAAALLAGGPGGASAPVTSVRELYDASGVVTGATDRTLSVALDEPPSTGAGKAAAAAASSTANGGGDAYEPSLGDKLRLDRLADDVTFRRLAGVLKDLREYRHGPAAKLLRILFAPSDRQGEELPEFEGGSGRTPLAVALAADGVLGRALRDDSVVVRPADLEGLTAALAAADSAGSGDSSSVSPHFPAFHAYNRGLNDGQRAAIGACLAARQLCMVHGPPGTGKTTTVVEYIRQEVARGRRVLACAPSNVAVDNLVERLAVGMGGSRPTVVRLGHPARMSDALQRHSLDARVRASEGTGIVNDVRAELAEVQRSAARTRDRAARRELRAEERRLRHEIRAREEGVVAGIIRGADVVACTITGAATRVLRAALSVKGDGGAGVPPSFRGFDVVVIDEVAQAVEASAYIPTLLAPKLVVAGDHCQLPPTVLSADAARRGLALTLADRVVARFGRPADAGGSGSAEGVPPAAPGVAAAASPTTAAVVHMLTTQYRMHAAISDWASGALYHGRLAPDGSVAGHTLADLPHVAAALAALRAADHTAGADGAELSVRVTAAALAAVHAAAADATREKAAAAKAAESAPVTGGGAAGAGAKGRPHGRPAAPPPPASSSGDGGIVATLATQAAALGGAAGDDGDGCAHLEVDVASLLAPMLLVDTAGCDGCEEVAELGGDSKANVGEADVVVKHVLALSALGLRPGDMAVITPYNAQVALLRALLGPSFPGLEVRSVDGFQGQEKEAVILSLVRSNTAREVGFLADSRRLNVAITRARRHVAVVADSDTVSADAFIGRLLEYVGSSGGGRGEVRSAAEYALTGAMATAATVTGSGAVDLARYEPTAAAAAGRAGRKAGRGGGGSGGATAKVSGARGAGGGGDAPQDPDGRARLAAFTHQLTRFRELCRAPAGEGTGAAAVPVPPPADAARLKLPPATAVLAATAAVTTNTAAGGGTGMRSMPSTAALAASLLLPRLDFSPALSSYERMLVHVAATAAGLAHASTGEGRHRRAVVYGPTGSGGAGGGVTIIAAASEAASETALSSTAATAQASPPPTPLEQQLVPSESAWAALQESDDDEAGGSGSESSVDGEGAVPAAAASAAPSSTAPAPSVSAPAPASAQVPTLAAATEATAPPPPPPAPPGSRRPVVTSGKSGTAAGGAGPPQSLAAQLAAERRAREAAAAAGAGGKGGKSAAAPADRGLPSLLAVADIGAAAAPKPQRLGGGGAGTPATAAAPLRGGSGGGTAAAGPRAEFGLPVAQLKADALLSKIPAAASGGSVGATADGGKKSGGSNKNSKKKKAAASAAADDDDDDGFYDDMALLDALAAEATRCAARGCKARTDTVGCLCKHCRHRFCYEHGLPEVHGCGDAARAEARRDWTTGGGGLAAATGAPPGGHKPLKDWQRASVASKLHKRLDADASGRLSDAAKKGAGGGGGGAGGKR